MGRLFCPFSLLILRIANMLQASPFKSTVTPPWLNPRAQHKWDLLGDHYCILEWSALFIFCQCCGASKKIFQNILHVYIQTRDIFILHFKSIRSLETLVLRRTVEIHCQTLLKCSLRYLILWGSWAFSGWELLRATTVRICCSSASWNNSCQWITMD